MEYKILTDKKKRLDKYRPLPSEMVQNLDEWFRIELTYTSNAIEGNTLTRQETAVIVEKGLTVSSKSLKEHLEAVNHAKALDWIKEFIGKIGKSKNQIREADILNIHALILRGIDDANAGRYRNVPVRISGSEMILPNPRKVPELMKQFGKQINQKDKLHPVEIAANAHYELVTIHPFIDGNGRTARLLMNLIFLQYGYPPALIRKRDRLAYINSLEKAQLGGSKDDYYKIIIKAVDRSLDIYLKALDGDEQPKPEQEKPLLRIGQLAKQTGETNPTIRHWTKEGLLEVAEITESGYQLYAPEMVQRAKQIRELQKKRYSLAEIKEMV